MLSKFADASNQSRHIRERSSGIPGMWVLGPLMKHGCLLETHSLPAFFRIRVSSVIDLWLIPVRVWRTSLDQRKSEWQLLHQPLFQFRYRQCPTSRSLRGYPKTGIHEFGVLARFAAFKLKHGRREHDGRINAKIGLPI